MKFEKLKSFNKTKLIIYGTIISCLIIVITIFVSHSKYVYKDSITIMNGTVNYKPYDFKILEIYLNGENGYTETETMPSEGYIVNQDETYCFVDYDDDAHKIKNHIYTNDNGEHVIKELPKRSKCIIYFDKVKTASEKTFEQLAELGNLTSNGDTVHFDGTSCDRGCYYQENGVYEAEDDDGTSYYFRGTVENNYVKFGKIGETEDGADIWWRIIRINGVGSIRMIYAGISTNGKAPNQTDGTSVITVNNQTKFTYSPGAAYDNNKYVGFQYTDGVRNGHSEDSNAKTILETWFKENLNDEFIASDSKIDRNAGFCADRTAYRLEGTYPDFTITQDNSLGTGKDETIYGGNIRISITHELTFKCPDKENDLFTYEGSNQGTRSLIYPIGLITIDEIIYAGGNYPKSNSLYYLYNGASWWTMSPNDFYAGVLSRVYVGLGNGQTSIDGVRYNNGFRPVLNLTPGSLTSGDGTSSNPYVVD